MYAQHFSSSSFQNGAIASQFKFINIERLNTLHCGRASSWLSRQGSSSKYLNLFLYLVAHDKAIKTLQRARLGVADHHIKMGESR